MRDFFSKAGGSRRAPVKGLTRRKARRALADVLAMFADPIARSVRA